MKIVVSGINLFEGGPLSIYYDCMDNILKSKICEDNQVTIFVHKKELFSKYKDYVEIIELPKSRKSYIRRIYYEYFYFNKYSKMNKIDVWLSLHDITPRVKSKKIYTYCHNAMPFMKKNIKDIKFSWENVVFSFFYKYLYRINIKSAEALIVQSNWMRNKFFEIYPVNKIIVARPNIGQIKYVPVHKESEKFIFIYAAFPRYFKNFEIICEACRSIDRYDFEIYLTIDGTENNYSKKIRETYGNDKRIKWIGLQPREKIFEMYNEAGCLIFPSRLETWGLPISEFKMTNKPMILADLEYAHETLGEYEKCYFFKPDDADELANKMTKILDGKNEYESQDSIEIDKPYAGSWSELLNQIMG